MTRFAISGCTQAGIATLTGLCLNDIATNLDDHCLSRDPRLAESALTKRDMYEAGT